MNIVLPGWLQEPLLWLVSLLEPQFASASSATWTVFFPVGPGKAGGKENREVGGIVGIQCTSTVP